MAAARRRRSKIAAMASVYLDHNATTPVRPEAARAVAEAMMVLGNPSSVHLSLIHI